MNSLVEQAKNAQQVIANNGSVNAVAQASLTAKAVGEIQGKIVMAKQFPRNIDEVIRKVQSVCERESLAKLAEYEYRRGGTLITGASIRLLEAVAQVYGNIQTSWKEVRRDTVNHVSSCIAEAWDLENNVYSNLEFEVHHYRDSKANGKQLITDERDLYELIASQASRRQRKCLEFVIPRDIIEEAREICKKTLTNGVDIQKQIDKAVSVFESEFKVKLSQIETYFGINRRGFTTNTYLSLQKIFTSLRDGLARVEDYFPAEKTEAKAEEKTGNKLFENATEKVEVVEEVKPQPKSTKKAVQQAEEKQVSPNNDGQLGFNFFG